MPELPNGLDRADGLDGRLGTDYIDGQILAQDETGDIDIQDIPIEELDDSPEIERGEQGTVTHTFRMGWDEALQRIQTLGRGTVLTDASGNITKVLSAKVKHLKPDLGLITIIAESLSFDLPPDEFNVVPVKLDIPLLKHPRYFYAFLGDGVGSATEQVNQCLIRFIQDYFDNPSAQYRNEISKMICNSIPSQGKPGDPIPKWIGGKFSGATYIPGTPLAKAAAIELIQKHWRGIETPYIAGFQLTWSQYYRGPVFINGGGYIEDPIYDATPQIPSYFCITQSGATIFDLIAKINPQCYSSNGLSNGTTNISWLRESDQESWERTLFKLTRTWIGSPVGHWDTELFTAAHRPQVPYDYLPYNNTP